MEIRIGCLLRRSEFIRVTEKGKKSPQKGMVLQVRKCQSSDKHSEPNADLWYGITVSRKVGKAVARSRAKRRLRSVARNVLPRIASKSFDYVLIGRQGTLSRSYPDLLTDLENAIKKLGAARKENETAKNSHEEKL